MMKVAPLTKLLSALFVAIGALLTEGITALLVFAFFVCAATLCVRPFAKALKAAAMLLFFSVLLYLVQLLFGSSREIAIVSALRMMIMSLSILLTLLTTKTQQITAALVKQCRMPYSYAFMITAVLRFVPDLLAESQAVREAQACRGYKPSGNPLKRLLSYMAVIKPMVFGAIRRSELMAASLEMRGFSNERRTFMAETKLRAVDYACIAASGIGCCLILRFAG